MKTNIEFGWKKYRGIQNKYGRPRNIESTRQSHIKHQHLRLPGIMPRMNFVVYPSTHTPNTPHMPACLHSISARLVRHKQTNWKKLTYSRELRCTWASGCESNKIGTNYRDTFSLLIKNYRKISTWFICGHCMIHNFGSWTKVKVSRL